MMTLQAFSDCDTSSQKFIATLADRDKYLPDHIESATSCSILIGPEGDFNVEELKKLESKGYQKVSLGTNVLRTETAGVVVAQIINQVNRY